ncbi:hypothetical protein Y032_0006g2885 [Ancylostoma ceylanicum]|uniref:Uncharacterized protein n=1 Tax=Ancylostoma ceylanicum TaxID=53326 RepID=A0A016VPD7_9BILA|nr:hypothetical protein Y032_0006g2885 [Ancylostoma ceylanicum]
MYRSSVVPVCSDSSDFSPKSINIEITVASDSDIGIYALRKVWRKPNGGGDLSSESDDVAGSGSVVRDVGAVAENAAVVASRALLWNVSLGTSEGLRQRRRDPSASGAAHCSTTSPTVALRADVDAQPKRLATFEGRLMDAVAGIVII